MKSTPFPVSNRRLTWLAASVLWLALASCGPPQWRGGIHARLAWSPAGVRVVEVPADSPAEQAGLRVEDRLLAIDGRPTAELSSEEVQRRLSGEVGSTVDLEVLRGDQRLTLRITREPYAKPGTLVRAVAPGASEHRRRPEW